MSCCKFALPSEALSCLQVQEVLRHIEASNLMPPLVVLSTLAKNPQLKLSVVKGYIARQLEAESAHIEDDRAAIARYQQESAQMRADVEELKSKVGWTGRQVPCLEG